MYNPTLSTMFRITLYPNRTMFLSYPQTDLEFFLFTALNPKMEVRAQKTSRNMNPRER